MANAKKQNFIVSYFKPFGIRQICDLLMLSGAIVLIVGLCLNNIVIVIGLSIFILGSLLAIIRSTIILLSKINKRSPEYKNAIVNTIVMALVLILSVAGLLVYYI